MTKSFKLYLDETVARKVAARLLETGEAKRAVVTERYFGEWLVTIYA